MDTTNITIPKPKIKTGIKDFFLYTGFFVILYTIIGTFISFSFSIINTMFPDRQYTYSDPYGSGLRLSVAMLIVLTPIVILLLRKIYTDLRAEPERRDLWVRRWGLYITLVLTVVAFVSDLITLIYKYLGGEISARFVWKVIIVLVLSGVIWMFTHAELKNAMSMNPKKTKIATWVLVAALVASIITGISFIGSPTFLRNVRDDNTRESDLTTIQYRVISYYQNKGNLPISLTQVTEGMPDASKLPVDPQSGEDYGYSVLPERMNNGVRFIAFNVCANFEEDGTADNRLQGRGGKNGATTSMTAPSLPAYDYEYSGRGRSIKVIDYDNHPEGNKCFDVEIDTSVYKPYNQPYPIY